MLKITTDKKYAYQINIDSFFKTIQDKSVFNKDVYKKIMRKIDKAELLDTDLIETPFGKTTLNNLSTGCKTVILSVFLSEDNVFIPLGECGNNALSVLFELSKQYNLKGYVDYPFILRDKDISCIINDKFVEGANNICDTLEEAILR